MNNEEILKHEIRKTAFQLETWAYEAKSGGWSTHQVEPMIKKANELWALLGKMG